MTSRLSVLAGNSNSITFLLDELPVIPLGWTLVLNILKLILLFMKILIIPEGSATNKLYFIPLLKNGGAIF